MREAEPLRGLHSQLYLIIEPVTTSGGLVADAVTSNQMKKSYLWRMKFGVDQKAENNKVHEDDPSLRAQLVSLLDSGSGCQRQNSLVG